MNEEATEVHEGRVWQGALTNLMRDLEISPGVYTPITKRMTGMGCAVQVKRGGGGQPSQWMVIKPPTIHLFQGTAGEGYVTKERQRIGVLEDQVASLSNRLSAAEHQIALLVADKRRRDHDDR